MLETKPSNIQIATLKGQWTEESARKAVRSWLQLRTSRSAALDLVGAQDDSMAMGARKAFQETAEEDTEDGPPCSSLAAMDYPPRVKHGCERDCSP